MIQRWPAPEVACPTTPHIVEPPRLWDFSGNVHNSPLTHPTPLMHPQGTYQHFCSPLPSSHTTWWPGVHMPSTCSPPTTTPHIAEPPQAVGFPWQRAQLSLTHPPPLMLPQGT